MKTIKARLNLTIFIMLGLLVGFGFVAFESNQKMEAMQTRLSQSLLMRDKVTDLEDIEHDPKIAKDLKKFKEALPEDDRRRRLSDVIQAYNSKNQALLKKRINEFQKQERKFFKVAQWKINKHKKSVHFNIILAALLPLMGLFGLLYYFNFGVLAPLQTLSKRMMEFLTDQYTFRFSSPPNNEIGNLERTFNSLAQKVLNNIDELQALDRAKSEFVSIASHELRTPLTSIKGSLGLLSSEIVGSLDPESKEMVQVAEQETDRLVRLINDMLDLAKIESHSLTLKKEWTPLSDVLHRSVQGIQGFATASKVSLEIQSQHNELEVNLDCDRIQQVITNLASNAIKYSPENGVVTVATQLIHNRQLEVSINDQGPGISEENQRLIFEKFRQATDSSNHLVKGTGLGLAISKALVEEHHGEIGVRSKPGQGSTFFFTLSEWRELQSPQESKAA